MNMLTSSVIKMSSREIAELTGKRLQAVLRKFRITAAPSY